MIQNIQVTVFDCVFLGIFLILMSLGLYYGSIETREGFDNALSNIFDFSAIFSALIFSFVYNQVNSYKQRKRELNHKIIELSYKVTDFRRLCRILINDRRHWDQSFYDIIRTRYDLLYLPHVFESEKNITDNKLLTQRSEFYDQDGDLKDFSGGKMLYLALKTIVLEQKGFYRNLPLMHDLDDDNVRYPQLLLEKWRQHQVSTSLYTWIADEKITTFRFDNISQEYRTRIMELCRKIDNRKYEAVSFSRDTLGEIGSDFDLVYTPKLLELTTSYNQPPSLITNVLITILLLLLSFGVLIPIYLTGIYFEDISSIVWLLNLSILIISISLFSMVLFGRRLIDLDMENH